MIDKMESIVKSIALLAIVVEASIGVASMTIMATAIIALVIAVALKGGER